MNKLTKKLALPIAGLGLMFAPLAAQAESPLVSFGENVNLFFNGMTGATYNSNVFGANSDKKEDFIWIFAPGAELNIGKDRKANLKVLFREYFKRYARQTEANTENATLTASGRYQFKRLRLLGNFKFMQVDQATPDTRAPSTQGRLIQRTIYGGGVKGEYNVSPKLDIAAGAEIEHTRFRNNRYPGVGPAPRGFIDRTTVTFPVAVYYKVTDRWAVGPSYQFSHTEFQNTGRSNSHFFGVAFRGRVTSKILAEVHVGALNYKRRGSPGGLRNISQTGIGFRGQLRWKATEKITVTGAFQREDRPSSTGSSSRATGGFLEGRYKFTQAIDAGARVGYNHTKYYRSAVNRRDKITNLGLNGNYKWTYWTFSGGWTYLNVGSNTRGVPYNTNVFTLTATLKY